MALQRIGYVVVFVRDLPSAARFYTEALGLQVVRRDDDGGVAELSFPGGGPNLLIEQFDKSGMNVEGLLGQFVGMSVVVADIAQTYQRLVARGVRFEGPPTRQSWGGVLAHFFDLDENMWSMVEYPDE